MAVGVVSDIHGNLEALQSVLDECSNRDIDEFVCLGDVVGYGADPAACVELIREKAAFTCAGNHDWAASGRIDTSNFNPMAAEAIRWTKEQLSDSDSEYLDSLTLAHRTGSALFVHGSPYEPEAFLYIFSSFDATAALEATDARLTFVGHSHRAFVCVEGEGEAVSGEGECSLAGGRALVNVGSVGQPRDGDPRAAFGVWDQDAQTIELVRVPYDGDTAQQKILDAGLPDFLARRLSGGR